MDWVRSGSNYTLASGVYRCRIWHTTAGPWGAIVSHNQIVESVTSFGTLEAAQLWCERWVRRTGQVM